MYILIGRSELDLSNETIRIQISISFISYHEKIDKNYRICYVAEKAYNFQTIKDNDHKFNITNSRL